jgi:formate-dependent nitrite reductase membrane component NrfD
VPAIFIISGVVMGVSGILLALRVRASNPSLPRSVFLLLVVGSVVAILPLPSRFFLLAFGVSALLRHFDAAPQEDELAPRPMADAR